MDRSLKAIVFRMDAFSPDSLPMARLAEYLVELAGLYGEEGSVHFNRVAPGSAKLVSRVEADAMQGVIGRLMLAGTAHAPDDINRPYRKLNSMLQVDHAVAVVRRVGERSPLLKFPGRKTPISESVQVVEQGSLDGTVIRVGGKDDSIPVWLRDADGGTLKCNAKVGLAKRIAAHLFEGEVRASGTGTWSRTSEGQWVLERFNITDFEALDGVDIEEATKRLQAIEGSEWNTIDDPLTRWRHLRDG